MGCNNLSNRGENSFKKLPNFAAKIYDSMMNLRPMRIHRTQIADILLKDNAISRLLDVGTGPGRLLKEISEKNSKIELYGLDISKAMIQLANKNLEGTNVILHHGPIQEPFYEDNFFDIVTCTGSFYLWDHPVEGLDEIYRILKPNCSVYLFESYKEYDEEGLKSGLRINLKDMSFFKRKILPYFLKKQLKMTYYSEKLREIIEQTKFSKTYTIDKITLANLPIWLCIKLLKET